MLGRVRTRNERVECCGMEEKGNEKHEGGSNRKKARTERKQKKKRKIIGEECR